MKKCPVKEERLVIREGEWGGTGNSERERVATDRQRKERTEETRQVGENAKDGKGKI